MSHGRQRRRTVPTWGEATRLALTWSEQTGLRYRVTGAGAAGWLVSQAPNHRFANVCPVCKKRHTYRPARRALA